MKPAIAAAWMLSIALAVGITWFTVRDSGPADFDADAKVTFLEVFGELDPLRRASLLSQALADFGPDDVPQLLEAIELRRMGIVWEEIRLIMVAWTSFDPEGAWEWANAGESSWRPTLIDQAIYGWAYHDGRTARRVLEAIEDPEQQLRFRSAMIDGWLRSADKEGVSDYIANFEDVRRRGRLVFMLAGEIMMAKGREGSMRWVESFPDDAPNEFKTGIFHHISKMIAVDDPLFAANWFLEHRTRSYTVGALEGIARRWSQHHDRPALFEWLLALNTEGIREGEIEAAIKAGFRTWMQVDPESAQAWLDSVLPNPGLDAAVIEAATNNLPKSPDIAMKWVVRIADESARNSLGVRIGRRWREIDEQAVRAWLAESDLSDNAKQQILDAPPSLGELNLAPKAAAGNP